MRVKLIQAWLEIRSSYYFFPGLMCLIAIGLAYFTTRIDLRFQSEIGEFLGWFYAGTAEGAKNILSVIAGSMISVAAVTFSLTMVAVTTASGQYGPRLISNFMRDRSNQFTLGMFLATFIYCLMVLRTVTPEHSIAEDKMMGLTPSLSVLIAMVLTLLSVAVLVFFVHHIPETLNVGKLTAKVGHELERHVERGVFPHAEGKNAVDVKASGDPFENAETHTVRANKSGFVQAISVMGLVTWASDQGARIRLLCMPGDFVVTGDPIMEVIADVPQDNAALDDHVTASKALHGFVALGNERTAHQNILFLADELVEIAARALSPGVNDPFTAINCLHWFETSCVAMMEREELPNVLADEAGTARLWCGSVDLERLVGCFFGQSRQYVAGDTNAARHALTVLQKLRRRASDSQRPIYDRQIAALQDAIRQGGLDPVQTERLMGPGPYAY